MFRPSLRAGKFFVLAKKDLDLRSPECFWFPVREPAESLGAVSGRVSEGWGDRTVPGVARDLPDITAPLS